MPSPPRKPSAAAPFWRTKTLAQMNEAEWESLCDGCGRCCLVKLEDEDTGRVEYTDIGCTLLDGETCRCRDYPGRQARVPDCVRLTPAVVGELRWLPHTCAYRLVGEGRDLPPWHPLVTGDPASVHAAGISVRGRVRGPEEDFAPDELADRVVRWPWRAPRRGGASRRAQVCHADVKPDLDSHVHSRQKLGRSAGWGGDEP